MSDPVDAISHEDKLDSARLQKLVYIGGYVIKNYCVDENDEQTFDYYLKHGDYLNEMDRGELKKPND